MYPAKVWTATRAGLPTPPASISPQCFSERPRMRADMRRSSSRPAPWRSSRVNSAGIACSEDTAGGSRAKQPALSLLFSATSMVKGSTYFQVCVPQARMYHSMLPHARTHTTACSHTHAHHSMLPHARTPQHAPTHSHAHRSMLHTHAHHSMLPQARTPQRAHTRTHTTACSHTHHSVLTHAHTPQRAHTRTHTTACSHTHAHHSMLPHTRTHTTACSHMHTHHSVPKTIF